MASVDTMPAGRSQQELLQAGRLKLEQYKQRRKGTSKNKNTPPSKKSTEPASISAANEQAKQQADGDLPKAQDASESVSGSQNGVSVSLSQGETEPAHKGNHGSEGSRNMSPVVDEMISTAASDKVVTAPLDSQPPIAYSKSDGISGPVESTWQPPTYSTNNQHPRLSYDKTGADSSEPARSFLLGEKPPRSSDSGWVPLWRSNPNPIIASNIQGSDDSTEPPTVQPGDNAEKEEVSKSEGFKNTSLSDLSSLNFLELSSTPPADVSTSIHAPLSLPSAPKPFFPSSTFVPCTQATEPDLKRMSAPVSTPSPSYPSLGSSLTSSSPFSNTPLRPISLTSPQTDSLQPATFCMENNHFPASTEVRSKPNDGTSAPVFDLFGKPSITSRPPYKSSSLSSNLQPSPWSSSNYSTALSQGSLFPVAGLNARTDPKIRENGNYQKGEMAEEAKKKEREAEEVKRKERETEEAKRRQREAEEARRKEREEFAGLEQHIQDLTEEKFALQRSLDKVRAMTEELASENSALAEDFNNQGQVVNQLREEIERLEGRIQEQEAFAKSLMSERDRAQLDSASALERSQTMAGEVIALENRIRTLRSHELKMERDMSTLTSEVESHKKQVASWEKDRAHLKSLIDALQEEKKVLQVRLRKLASGERDAPRTSEISEAGQPRERSLADASTSTEDLPVEPLTTTSEGPSTPLDSLSLDSWHHGRQFEEQHSGHSTAQTTPHRSSYQSSQPPFLPSSLSSDRYSHLLSSEPSTSSGIRLDSPQSGGYQTIHLPALSSSIPADLVRTINNINDIITSLGEEKTALVKSLKAESRGAAELRALNADLSRKLEATTQQLELVVAQRMAQGSSSAEVVTSRSTPAALDYVDEGDEVVDRVFTWIMRLFPGGHSRRNGVKRL